MRQPDHTTASILSGLMNLLAIIILLATTVWGVIQYPDMPDALPIHWDAAGEPDAWRPKSIGWAFGPLLIGAVMIAGFLLINRWMATRQVSVPSERQAYALTFAYLNLYIVALFSWTSIMAWRALSPGPWFLAFTLLGIVPILVILGIFMKRITQERRAAGVPDEPTRDSEHWRLGGFFYSNPSDPRTFVPKPPHTGMGWTFNLATPGGKLMIGALFVIVVGGLLLAILL